MRALLALLFVIPACGDDGDGPSDAANTLYHRLGEAPGVRTVVEGMMARVTADEKLNGYFLNRSVDLDYVTECFTLQISALAGGPDPFPGTSDCRTLGEAHAGLGISQLDFDDLMAHLVDALDEAGVATADRTSVATAMGALSGEIVEDATNDATVYQRVGRKPAISAVVTAFEARVAADARVNGFFAGLTDTTRLHACLTRQVCSIDGPCKYGEEMPEEFGDLQGQFPCRAMAPAHFGLMNTANNPIRIEDFSAIAENLIMELDAAGVTMADRNAIIGAIAPLCPQIVADGTGCP